MARQTLQVAQNLVLRSEELDNAAWTKRGACTITANQIANPVNGAVDADLVSGLGAAGVADMFNAAFTTAIGEPGQNYCPSFWIQRVSATGTVSIGAPVNGNLWGNMSINLANIGTGWVRVYPGHPLVTTTVQFSLPPSSHANKGCGGLQFYTTSGPLSFYLWGLQQNIGRTPCNYVKTTSAVVDNGSPRNLTYKTQNLVTFSEQFDNAAWTKSNFTVSANTTDTTDPLGTNTAEKITDSVDGGASFHYFIQNLPAGAVATNKIHTFSIYAKQGTKKWISITDAGGVFIGTFDLNTGLVGGQSGGTAYMESVGNGWYRCCFTGIPATTRMFVYTSGSGTTLAPYTGDGTGTFYVWGAQAVEGSTPGVYTQTTTSVVNNGFNIRNSVPTLQNLLTYSEQLNNGVWTSSGGTITANAAVAPDGTTTADQIQTSVATSIWYLNGVNYLAVVPGVTYYFSFYAKNNGGTAAGYRVYNITGAADIVAATSFLTQINNSTWTRVGVAFTAPAGCVKASVYPFSGAGGANFFVWGMQVNVGNSPLTYKQVVETPYNVAPIRSNSSIGQNLITYSNAYDTIAAWSNSNVTVSANTTDTTDYLGTNTADKLTDSVDGGAQLHMINRSLATVLTNGATCTLSVIMKKGTKNWFLISNDDATFASFFDLNTGTIGTYQGCTPSIISLGNGWYKCTIVGTFNSATPTFILAICPSDGAFTYTGDGTGTMYAGNAQVVASNHLGPSVVTAASTVTTPLRTKL